MKMKTLPLNFGSYLPARLVGVLLISLLPSLCYGQNHYYENFNITGTTPVCPNNSTVYTYYGPSSNLSWSVTGGTIVGSTVGSSVQVKWSSASNSLSATGDDENCWYDPEYWPPQQFCDITTYTSNAFSVSLILSLSPGLSSTPYCTGTSGATVTLLGAETSVSYRLKYPSGSYSSSVTGVTTYAWNNITATGAYGIEASKSGCTFVLPYTSTTVSQVTTPTAYTVGGGGAYCSGGSGVSVTLSGSQSGFSYQLKVGSSNSGSPVSGTGSALTWTNRTVAGTYTIVATNSGCSQTMTGSVAVSIDAASAGGTVQGATTLCSPASGQLTLQSNAGNVLRWEYLNGASWVTISNTTTTLSFSGLTQTRAYRAIVKNGTCAEAASSSATVTINDPAVGTLSASADFYATAASGQLIQGVPNSSIVRWEKNTGSGWTTIVNTSSWYNYSVTQSTSFRVVSLVGVCPESFSNVVNINLYAPVVANPATPAPIVPGGSVQLTLSSNYAEKQWYRDGNLLAGETGQGIAAKVPGLYYATVKGSSTATPASSSPVEVKGVVSSYQGSISSAGSARVLVSGLSETSSVYSLNANQVAYGISYDDGLGRTFQSIAIGQSPAGFDVVAPVGYRNHGLTDTTYLPYVTSLRDGKYRPNAIRGGTAENTYGSSEQWNFYQNTPKVAQDAYPYAVSLHANDPSLRTYEQGAPGQSWQPNSTHTVRTTMALNNSTNYKVRYWKSTGQSDGYYPDRSVVVSVITDENGNKVQTYTDVRGLTVLKQVQMDETLEGVSTAWLETYYVYDTWGRLKYIVPPKAMKVLGSTATILATHNDVKELIHSFVYDSRGRLVEKKVPASAVQYIVYDKFDRVALVQDGNMRLTNKWMFVKYDAYDRVVYTGVYENASQVTRASVQSLLDGLTYALPGTPWYETEQPGGVHGYSNSAFPTAISTSNGILSVNYYDHYNFDRSGADDYSYDPNHLTGQEAARSSATRGMATGSKTVVLDEAGAVTSTWLTSVVFYDGYDRPIQTQANNHLYPTASGSTLDKATIVYDFTKAVKSKATHFQNATTSVALEDWNDFDHAGRVLKTWRKINGGASQLLVQYEYNALGQLVDKKLHEVSSGGGTFLQSVDFRYTIRGWLKSINNAQLTSDAGATNDETNDYFGLELLYNSVESGLSNTAYYNGNISALKWKGPGPSGLADQRSYKYTYDKSDRLKTATFQANTGSAWTKEAGTLDENLTYDHNGNIKTLVRKENLRGNTGITITSTPQTIDNLDYVYPAFSPNRHIKIEDASGSTKGFNNSVTLNNEYKYDTLGNLKEDRNKGIASITYNILGKPQVITFTSGKKIEYLYDAAGTRLATITYHGDTVKSCTNYSGSFVYEGVTATLSFFGSPEGRVVKNGSSFEYQYALSDHQGNTRAVFTSATPEPVSYTANMESSPISGFENSTTNRVNFELYDHTDSSGSTYSYSQKLTGAAGQQVGVAKSFKVYPGDKIRIEAYAKYMSSSGSSDLSGFATALLAAFGYTTPPGGGEAGTPKSALNTWGGIVAAGGGNGSGGYPRAFVNLLVFDKDYNFLDIGWDQINGGEQVGASPKAAHDYMMQEYTAREEGYIYVYVSNENSTLVRSILMT